MLFWMPKKKVEMPRREDALPGRAEKMPIPTIERIRSTFPSAWFADAYGLTETVSGDTFLDPEHTVSKLGSVGRPCQYLELDLWDPSGATVPAVSMVM